MNRRPIPVVWLSFDDHLPGRCCWDQTLIGDLLSGDLWPIPGAVFTQVGQNWPGLPEEGCIAVLPGRYHVDRMDEVNAWLARLPWCLLIVTSDEESLFPYLRLDARPNLAVWAMTPDPNRAGGCPADVYLGEGFTPHTTMLGAWHEPATRVGFAGQVTHDRRRDLARHMRHIPGARTLRSPGFTQGLDPDDYVEFMADLWWAPAPSGPATVDSFRLYEALQVGAVPIVERRNGAGVDQGELWRLVYGDGWPVPIVDSWAELPGLVAGDWPNTQRRTQDWWSAYRRSLATSLADTVTRIGPTIDRPNTTALVVTSPIPAHPSTDIIASTIESVRYQLPDADIIVAADGVRPEQAHLADRYGEYLRRLHHEALHHWHGVQVVTADQWWHQANLTRLALEYVDTPLVLFVEHDTPLTGDWIDWRACEAAVHHGALDAIRFHYDWQINPSHLYLFAEEGPTDLFGPPVWVTGQWSQRPHLARTDRYAYWIDRYFGRDARTMIEDSLHGVVEHHWNRGRAPTTSEAGFLLAVYYPTDGTPQRSTHLDGRGDEPKYEMRWGYDGRQTPPGAPHAARDE